MAFQCDLMPLAPRVASTGSSLQRRHRPSEQSLLTCAAKRASSSALQALRWCERGGVAGGGRVVLESVWGVVVGRG